MNILILDPHPVMAEALTLLLRRILPTVKITYIQKLASFRQTVETLGQPDVIVVDPELPNCLSTMAVSAATTLCENAKVFVFHSRSLTVDLSEFATVQIGKFLPVKAIEQIFRNVLIEKSEEPEAVANAAPVKLSKRQRQLLIMLDNGKSNREIGVELNISEHTVKVHFWRLYKRLGVNSRTSALAFARKNGWL